MEFANLLLLFGGLALAVPLVIHLLNRSKFEVVPWAAMHLLQAIERQNQKRLKWRSWLLLLIRCLIPLLLAVCMARPLLTAWRTAGPTEQTSLTVLLDNSYSLQAPVDPDQNGRQWVSEQLEQLLDSGVRRIQYSVLAAGSVTENLTEGVTFSPYDARESLTGWTSESSQLDAATAIRSARNQALGNPLGNRQILVISDFQTRDWEPLLTAQNEDPDSKIQWAMLPVPVTDTPNLQVRLVHPYQESVGRGESLEVLVEIINWSDQLQSGIPVELRAADRPVANRRIDLQPRARAQLTFGLQFDQAGTQDIEVQITDTGWPTDDRDSMQVTVVDSLHVLLIEGPTNSPDRSAGFYWEMAQRAASGSRSSNWLTTRRCRWDQLREPWIREADVVVLLDVPSLEDSSTQSLIQAVQQGTGLLIFCGEQMDVDQFNDWASDSGPVLPAKLSDWNPGTRLPLAGGPYAHPALSYFSQSGQDLSETEIYQYRKLLPKSESQVLLTAGPDEPFLVSGKLGDGQVLICATICNDVVTNLPLQSSFVPLVQRLLFSFSGKGNESRRPMYESDESRRQYLDTEQQEKLAVTLKADRVRDMAEFQELLATRQNGWEIWRYVLAGLVIFLFVELLIQRPLTEAV